jgi:hypothetical protein
VALFCVFMLHNLELDFKLLLFQFVLILVLCEKKLGHDSFMLMIIFSHNFFSKFNIPYTLGLKFMKSSPCKAPHQRLYNNIKNMPKFPYYFYF